VRAAISPRLRGVPEAEKLDVAALQTAAEYAEKQQSRALIVTRHGYIVFEKYWQGSNLEHSRGIGGLGRVVAALATGVAITDRKIGWPDEPIGYLIPALSKDKRGEITVRNLLQMSSGLGSSASPYSTSTIKRYLNLPSEAPPGTRWLDQGVDPDLLAYAIQTATGKPYADYLSQAIWARIGAGDAWICWTVRAGMRTWTQDSLHARVIGFVLLSFFWGTATIRVTKSSCRAGCRSY